MNDTLDDVFGADEGEPGGVEEHMHTQAQVQAHPSDMRRLETEHSTAGYREGIAQGKEATLQEGFDQGYSVGAAIGLQAGQILGLLEGIHEAVKGRPGDDEASARVGGLLSDARGQLCVEAIFGSEYWSGTGEGVYPVDLGSGETPATAHPLIQKWSRTVEEEIGRWAVDKTILAHVNPQGPQGLTVQEQEHEHHDEPAPAARNPLDW